MPNATPPPNKYLRESESMIAEKCRENSEKGIERLKVTTSKISTLLQVPTSTLYNNHVPGWFEEVYDCADWEKNQGLIIDPIDDFIKAYEEKEEKREELRKERRKEKIRDETIEVGSIYD